MVHAVYVAVADVDPDGPEREAVFLPRTMDGDGRPQHIDRWTEVPAGRGVAGRRVGGEGVRRHGAGERREAAVLLDWMQADGKNAHLLNHKTDSTRAFPSSWISPDGMITDKAVADADLMTLLPGLELCFSPSPDKC